MIDLFKAIINIQTPFNMIVLIVLIASVAGVLSGIAARKFASTAATARTSSSSASWSIVAWRPTRSSGSYVPNRPSGSRPKKWKFSHTNSESLSARGP